MDRMVSLSFSNQMMFQKSRDNAFMDFMNEQVFTPTYMAQYTDMQLR